MRKSKRLIHNKKLSVIHEICTLSTMKTSAGKFGKFFKVDEFLSLTKYYLSISDHCNTYQVLHGSYLRHDNEKGRQIPPQGIHNESDPNTLTFVQSFSQQLKPQGCSQRHVRHSSADIHTDVIKRVTKDTSAR